VQATPASKADPTGPEAQKRRWDELSQSPAAESK